jgi:antibiotic biosynthesis monooxygenase (ABM) superfamily enzyme
MSGSQPADKAQVALDKGAVTIVTQTRVRPESADAFARWQGETSKEIAGFPGFIE